MVAELTFSSEEVLELAEQVAAATGETVVEAVKQALRQRLRRVQLDTADWGQNARQHEAEFYHLIRGSRERWRGAMLSLDHGDILYDEYGAPR